MIHVTGPVEDRGVYYNAVNALFNIKDERAEFARYDISVSLLEIYNENVKDLLGSGEGPEYLEIRRGPQGVFVPGLEEVPVGNADEVMEVLMRGNERRAVATTKMNEASSRSHSLLCVNVVRTTRPTAERPQGGRTRSQLTLVDLAGSERLSKSEAKGQAQKEAQHVRTLLLFCAADLREPGLLMLSRCADQQIAVGVGGRDRGAGCEAGARPVPQLEADLPARGTAPSVTRPRTGSLCKRTFIHSFRARAGLAGWRLEDADAGALPPYRGQHWRDAMHAQLCLGARPWQPASPSVRFARSG